MDDLFVVGRDEFMNHRKNLEKIHLERIKNSQNPIDSILTVEVNTTELCNKKCVFCPRVNEEIYPNQNINMTPYVASVVAKKLQAVQYTGRISFSGYGENLLNDNFAKIVQAFRRTLGDQNIIECNTNGTVLDVDYINKLFHAGLSYLYINLYDKKVSTEEIQDLFDRSSAE